MSDADIDFNKSAKERFYLSLGMFGFTIAVLGQEIRDLHTASGDFLMSQFLRHHLSNLGDVVGLAPGLNYILMTNKKLGARSRPVLAGFLALGVGAVWEGYQSTRPGRSFDWLDIAAYGVSLGVFLMIARYAERRHAAPPAPTIP